MISYDHKSCPGSPIKMENLSQNVEDAAIAMPVILENGRKVFGPPPNYKDPRPTYECELYVTRIPQHLNELAFLVWLHRIGPVYEFRLMMDTGNSTRGYAFIRFCSEKDALAAFELLKYLFVGGGEDRLGVYRSQGKNRLFISGIPRQIPLHLLEDNFKLCFPQMRSCTAYAPLTPLKHLKMTMGLEKELNRGFAFIEFSNHEMALEAKKKLTPGRVRMWGVDLKVQWAKPKEGLQVRPGLKIVNGYPSNRNNTHGHVTDYCAKLRLYCLANNFCIPIVVYGPSFLDYNLQYAAILLKHNSTGLWSMFIFEIMVASMHDIHLLMCELAVKMIERQSGQLHQHALFRIVSNTKAEMVHTFKTFEELRFLNLSRIFKIPKVIKDIAISLELLADQNSEKLLVLYKRSFLTHQSVASFDLDVENSHGKFYSILPKFRNNTKLNNNFNDMEIILLQNPTTVQLAASHALHTTNFIILNRNGAVVQYQEPKQVENVALKSQLDYYRSIKYLLRHVDLIGLEKRTCYHSAQRVNSNPVWIAGQSYQQSIYN